MNKEEKILIDLSFSKSYQNCQAQYEGLDEDTQRSMVDLQRRLMDYQQTQEVNQLTIDQIILFINHSVYRFYCFNPYENFTYDLNSLRKLNLTLKNQILEQLIQRLNEFAFIALHQRLDHIDNIRIMLSDDSNTFELNDIYNIPYKQYTEYEKIQMQTADRSLSTEFHAMFAEAFTGADCFIKKKQLINHLVQLVQIIKQFKPFTEKAQYINLNFMVEIPLTEKIVEIIKSDVMKKLWINQGLVQKATLLEKLKSDQQIYTLRADWDFQKKFPLYFLNGESILYLISMVTLQQTMKQVSKPDQVFAFDSIFDELERIQLFLDQFKN